MVSATVTAKEGYIRTFPEELRMAYFWVEGQAFSGFNTTHIFCLSHSNMVMSTQLCGPLHIILECPVAYTLFTTLIKATNTSPSGQNDQITFTLSHSIHKVNNLLRDISNM